MLAVVAAGLAVSLVSSGSAGLRATVQPTLYFMYTMNCTFTIVNDAGNQVTSIPPGTYQVDVRTPIPFGTLPPYADDPASDMTACKGIAQFQLSGPGVNVFTTLAAGCVTDYIVSETFQPNAIYSAEDLNQPSVAHASFTTLASGTPPAPVATTYGGVGKSVATSSADLVGSNSLLGTLNAKVSPTSNPTLTINGKPVSKLAAGRYTFVLSNLDPRSSFKLLGPASTSPTSLTRHLVTISLTAGRWTYFTSLKTIHYFRVTG
jgi:hypothetical protein